MVRPICQPAELRQALEESAQAAGIRVRDLRRGDLSQAAAALHCKCIERAVDEIAAMPVLDPRSPREIMDDLNA